MKYPLCLSLLFLATVISVTACTGNEPCPVTEPAWVLPPEDSAVMNEPAHGYYFVNEDNSIWTSAYWPLEEHHLLAGEDGNKMGWFRNGSGSRTCLCHKS